MTKQECRDLATKKWLALSEEEREKKPINKIYLELLLENKLIER